MGDGDGISCSSHVIREIHITSFKMSHPQCQASVDTFTTVGHIRIIVIEFDRCMEVPAYVDTRNKGEIKLHHNHHFVQYICPGKLE